MESIRTIAESRRGNALLLAVLILLSLTSLGVISVQLTNTDLMVTGNLARSSQAESIGRAGAAHGMALVGAKPMKFYQAMGLARSREYGTPGTGTTELGMDIIGASTADPTPSTNPDPLADLFKTVLEDPDPANTDYIPTISFTCPGAGAMQDVAYDVVTKFIGETRDVEGHSLKADICSVILDFNARGGVPTGEQDAAATLEQEDTVVVRSRARALATPVQCRLR